MNVEVKMAGFTELIAELEALPGQTKKVEDAALDRGAQIMLEAIRRSAARAYKDRTGTLTDSLIIGAKRRRGPRRSISIGAFGEAAPHAHLVEFGHGGPKPAPEHPFIRPAYETARAEAYAAMAQAIREAIEK